MAGKSRVSEARLDGMLAVLTKHPSFVGQVRLHPDGSVEISTVASTEIAPEDEPKHQSDLTADEVAGLRSRA